MLPLPAWPKLTIWMPDSRDSCSRPAISSGIRDTGTTTSSLIFFGAALRKAGERALRVFQSRSISSRLAAEWTSSIPSLRAAASTAWTE